MLDVRRSSGRCRVVSRARCLGLPQTGFRFRPQNLVQPVDVFSKIHQVGVEQPHSFRQPRGPLRLQLPLELLRVTQERVHSKLHPVGAGIESGEVRSQLLEGLLQRRYARSVDPVYQRTRPGLKIESRYTVLACGTDTTSSAAAGSDARTDSSRRAIPGRVLARHSKRRPGWYRLSHQHIAPAERTNRPKSFPFEHAERTKPRGDGTIVGYRIGFDDSASVASHGCQGRSKREAGDAGTSIRSVYKETGDSPSRRLAEARSDLAVLSAALDSGQVLPTSKLAPPDRIPLSIDQHSLGVSAPKQRPVVSSVCLLTGHTSERTGGPLSVVEHAPAPSLNTVVPSEESLKVAPSGWSELVRFERAPVHVGLAIRPYPVTRSLATGRGQ